MMYKIFALVVLMLAPIAVTLVSSFVPSTETAIAPVVASSPVETVTVPPSAPVTAPAFEPLPSPPPVADGAALATAAPMLDPRGIDPTPQAVEGSETSSDTPASETAPVEVPDSSNDDRPDS
ncbi:hypothetical protein [Sphingobium sp. SCG-1]|uniref:hypothetical protein n=1 Tax=Sphingobium sp. SCG-1 TaxID=2072936 RepID=UPI0011AB7A1F|nr:hypothetical protein [Sphingobium sp. SCG-1]